MIGIYSQNKKSSLFIIGVCILLLSCNSNKTAPDPKIKDAFAKISGFIVDERVEKDGGQLLILNINNAVIGELVSHETTLDSNNYFIFEVPIQADKQFALLSSDEGHIALFIYVDASQETKLEIKCNKEGNIHVTSNTFLNSYDMTEASNLFIKMSQYGAYDTLRRRPDSLWLSSPERYLNLMINDANYRIDNVVTNDTILSQPMKLFLSEGYRFFTLSNSVFSYPEEMDYLYRRGNPKEKWDDFTAPPKPDIAYYSFLKDLDLNNPQHLYNDQFSLFIHEILLNETLNIAPIGDASIDLWVNDAKSILSDLVGFDSGLFYDLLISNSYGRQLQYGLRPLSQTQKDNITSYFGDNEIAKVLFKSNQETERLAKGHKYATINKTPAVAKEEMMDAIVSNYTGKVVVVDFWATWCGACINATNEFREHKGGFIDKNVVFVYITSDSSPQKLWKEMIDGIGGEHYYLTSDTWSYIMEQFDFTAIPTYLIYDKNGTLKRKRTSFMGNEKMSEWIEECISSN